MMGSTWRAALLLGATFAGGVVAGGAVMNQIRPEAIAVSGHGHGTDEFLRLLTDSLSLSVAQQDSVRGILARSRPAFDSVWHDIEPRFETLRTTVRSEIRSQLSPDQQRHF